MNRALTGQKKLGIKNSCFFWSIHLSLWLEGSFMCNLPYQSCLQLSLWKLGTFFDKAFSRETVYVVLNLVFFGIKRSSFGGVALSAGECQTAHVQPEFPLTCQFTHKSICISAMRLCFIYSVQWFRFLYTFAFPLFLEPFGWLTSRPFVKTV